MVGEAGDGREVLERVQELEPDVLLLEDHLPLVQVKGGDGYLADPWLPDDALEQFALFLGERRPHLTPATPEQRAQASLVMVAHNP